MGVIDLFPATRRALQNTRNDVNSLQRRLDEAIALLGQTEARINAHTDKLIAIQGAHENLHFEALYRREDESPLEGRKRFFASIPPATGNARLAQLANLRLLVEIDAICREHNIRYWLAFGALLGAVTRGGCIPWDDDIDVCMLREDVDRFIGIVANNSRFQVSVVYDWYVFCKQVRFSLRDAPFPCFVDLSIWDWATDASAKHDARMHELRVELMGEIVANAEKYAYWRSRGCLYAQGSGRVAQCVDIDPATQDAIQTVSESDKVENLFFHYREKAKTEGLLCAEGAAGAISHGLDQIYDVPRRRFLWPNEMVFPLKEIEFEGKRFFCPRDSESFLDSCYIGWPYLPDDMLDHSHFSTDALQDATVREQAEAFIDEI